MCIKQPTRRIILLAALFGLALPISVGAGISSDRIWRDTPESTIMPIGERQIVPSSYRTVSVDRAALDALLYETPMEQTAAALTQNVVLTMPLPTGAFGRFQIVESPIMEPELAAAYPQIKTYRGQGIDDPSATLRFSVTPHGFHGQILSTAGRIFLDPFSVGDQENLVVYFTRDYLADESLDWTCEAHAPPMGPLPRTDRPAGVGVDLRVYRLALAATGEYTTFHGGTVPAALAAQVLAMNRVNGVYETEVAIRMMLIADNDQIIYTDPATDPYSNFSGGAMLGQNQSNLDAVIGDANYDIGHVFSTGGGGVASLRVPCKAGLKARGVTGLSSPIGDVFYIDFVAHEMGHQWGGNHTFNGNSGACAGGNRNGSTAYEPGSGSTIQAYAGICGSQNTQSNSDDYFHAISLDEIVAYSRTSTGNNCPSITSVGNQPPVVSAGDDFTIPLETPFELCGSATDPDASDQGALTYNWEQWDLGPAGDPNSPVGDAPIFRSFPATSTGSRVFPQWSDILGNTQTIGEILPTYARTMNFRLTARDNRAVAGTFGDNMAGATPTVQITASDGAGPFLVTAPNGAENWSAGTVQTVTWDVAGTDAGAVACATVSISLSLDGGMTYPLMLTGEAANDGSQTVTVPAAASGSARVLVRCKDNIFFDVSNGDFSIDASGSLLRGSTFEQCNALQSWDQVVR